MDERRWRRCPGAVALFALATVTLSPTGVAQKVVRANENRSASALERQVAALARAETRGDAQRALLRTGIASVPLLLRAIRRQDGATPAALEVLVALGKDAAPAVPVLRRMAVDKATPAIANALAMLDGPAVILVPGYVNNEVVELDMSGKVLRKLEARHPWAVEPAPDDRLRVLEYGPGTVRELDWQGEAHGATPRVHNLTSRFELDDGSHIETFFDGDGHLRRMGADGAELWSRQNGAIRCMRQFDRLYVPLGQHEKGLVMDLDGAVVRTVGCGGFCMSIRPLPDGKLLIARKDGHVRVLNDRDKVVLEHELDTSPHDAQLLRDQRFVVFASDGVRLLAADGSIAWHYHEVGYTGPGFVRER